MSRMTRGEAEADRMEMERERELEQLRNPNQPKPADTEPKTPLGWAVAIIGFVCLVGFFLAFYFGAVYLIR